MKEEYDLSKMKTRPNPYAKRLKKQVTLRIGQDVIDYFKGLSEKNRCSLSKPDKPLPA
jgi:uncharacterized protein (DUF4415 family)